jgi:hypothetical protein
MLKYCSISSSDDGEKKNLLSHKKFFEFYARYEIESYGVMNYVKLRRASNFPSMKIPWKVETKALPCFRHSCRANGSKPRLRRCRSTSA